MSETVVLDYELKSPVASMVFLVALSCLFG